MRKTLKRCLTFAMAGVMTLSMLSLASGCEEEKIILKNVTQAKNVILMIGDGMGPEQIKAGELYKDEKLTMQKFPYMTKVETRCEDNLVTDSAAAATALATGVRTLKGVVGKDSSYQELETIVDIAHNMGKRTGILATEELFGATPMGFSGHADDRNLKENLLQSASASSNVDLFVSYMMDLKYHTLFTDAGYEKITMVEQISDSTADKVFGSYEIRATLDSMHADGGEAAFDRIVTEALEYLSKDEDGFFLMAEGSHIDHGGHNNDFPYMLRELIAFDDAVNAVLKWAKDRDDTVVIVTADHETGGLEVYDETTHDNILKIYETNRSWYGQEEYFEWNTTGHTSTDVYLYINGADVDFAKYSFGYKDRVKNTDVFQIMKDLMEGKNTEA